MRFASTTRLMTRKPQTQKREATLGRQLNQQRQLTRQVTLSSGKTVTVGQISWGGWKTLKSALFFALDQGEIKRAVEAIWKVFQSLPSDKSDEGDESNEGDEGTASLETWLTPEVINLLPDFVKTVSVLANEMSEEVVRGCITDVDHDAYTLPAADLMRLRQAALEVNDFSELIALEKNFFPGIAAQIKSVVSGISSVPSHDTGGLESSTS
jgi:hypothetical protein